MEVYLTDVSYGQHPNNPAEPFAAAYTCLPSLEPMPYLPKAFALRPIRLRASHEASVSPFVLSMTSLPGCTSRASMDLFVGMSKSTLSPVGSPAATAATAVTAVAHQGAYASPHSYPPDLTPSCDLNTSVFDTEGTGCDTALIPPLTPSSPHVGNDMHTHHQQRPQQRRQHCVQRRLHSNDDEMMQQSVPQSLSEPSKCSLLSDNCSNSALHARRTQRLSIDATMCATMLCTSPASSQPSDPEPAANPFSVTSPPRVASSLSSSSSNEMVGCAPPELPLPHVHVCRQAPLPLSQTVAMAESLDEWSFGDNLQRTRLLARYAAAAAAEELRYDPSPGSLTALDSDSGRSAHSGVSPRRSRSRSAWRLFYSLVGSSRSTSSRASSNVRQRRQDTIPRDCLSSCECGQGRGGGNGEYVAAAVVMGRAEDEKPTTPVVVRSRDSRKMMRVRRTRVGIDLEGQVPTKQQQPTGRATAPTLASGFILQQQQQEQQRRQALSRRTSAPELFTAWTSLSRSNGDCRNGEGGSDDDEASAAIIQMAEEFAALQKSDRLL